MFRRPVCQFLISFCVMTMLFVSPLANAAPKREARQEQQTSASRSYFSANGLLNRGLYDLAATEYESFLAKYRQHEKTPMAHYGLAVCLFRQQQFEAALKHLQPLQYDDAFVYHAEVEVMAGHTHMVLRQYKYAAEAFDEVLNVHSKHDLADDATAGATEALYSLGQYAEAIQRCQLLVTRWPRSPHRDRIELLWGMSAMASEDFEAAAKHLSLLLERSSKGDMADQAALLLAQAFHHLNSPIEAIRQYRDALARGAKQYTAEAMLGLATLLHQKGALDEASSLLNKLLSQYPDGNLTVPAQFRLARVRFDEKNYKEALPVFRSLAESSHAWQDESAYWAGKCELRLGHSKQASERFNNFTESFKSSEFVALARYDKALALIQAGEAQDGVAALREFREMHPDHPMSADALYMIVSSLHQQRSFDDSLDSAKLFLQTYKKHEMADSVAFVLAENYYLSSQYDKAVSAYDRLLKDFPRSQHLGSALHRLGVSLYHVENFKRSSKVLNQAISEYPSAIGIDTSYFVLGDMSFQRGEWNQALKHFESYVATSADAPSTADALLKMGLCYQRQEQYQPALAKFDQLLSQFPGHAHRVQATFEKGQALIALGRKAQARKAFSEVVKESPSSAFAAYARNHLASIAMSEGKYDQAATFLEELEHDELDGKTGENATLRRGQALLASEQYERAEAVLASLVESDAAKNVRAQALAHLTVSLTRQDRCTDALKTAKQMTKSMANSLDLSLLQSFQYERAWCYRQAGHSDEAAKLYQGILAAGGSNNLKAHALLDLGAIAYEAKQFEQALKHFQKLQLLISTNQEDNFPRTLKEQLAYRLGVSSFELQQYNKAATSLTNFAEAFPQSSLIASASFYCGESLYKLGNHGRAVPHFSRVVDEFQDDATYRPCLLRLGQSLAELQRWARCEQIFTTFLTKFHDDPQHFQASFGIGWARENQARYAEAIRSYQSVIDSHTGPTAARAQFQIGECYFALKEYEHATRELLKVDILYAYPQWSAAALYEAGRCFEMMAKNAEARTQFAVVTEKYGDSKWAPLAKQRLTSTDKNSIPGK